ncbi:hypothetical protein A6723_024995 [Pseudomonas sp. AU11447]|uniref:acyltransferase family protein n=1 Tax=unclassified Pseudomonas TaxID=196821 RepID=UPI0006D42D65|nr:MULTISPECIES: acyltransferase [unclassified Pseudomonas]OBY91309.1 hypothetical protein A6723_024995 [Pseudomonas sp. AU11447]
MAAASTRNQWLDICRSLAISLVLLSHGRHFLTPAFPAAQNFKFGGFLGVELFFVLSGFLIGGIILRSAEESRSAVSWVPLFWTRRWLRTLPNYLLFLTINIALAHSIRPADLPNIFYYITFTQSLAWQHPPFFGEAWSLAVEEIFYLLSPLLIAAFMYFGATAEKAMLRTAMLVILTSTTLRILALILNNPTMDEGLRKITVFRLDSIMFGVLAALLVKRYKEQTTIFRLAVGLSVIFFVCGYVASWPDSSLNESYAIRSSIFTMASLGGVGLVLLGITSKIRCNISFVTERISRWSYSAYLANLPVLMLLMKFKVPVTDSLSCIALFLAFIFLTFLVSALVYKFFEAKILRLRDKKFSENIRTHVAQ